MDLPGGGRSIKKIRASTERTGVDYKKRPVRNPRWYKFFYINGKLHKLIQHNRGLDLLVAWCYKDRCRYSFSYTEIRKNATKAYSLKEVEYLLGRHKTYIRKLFTEGEKVKPPERIYTLDGNYRPGKYLMSEQDIMDLHEYFSSTHVGRPRSDGLITHWGDLPSKLELRAMLQNNQTTYVKSGGEYVPVWKGGDW